MAGHHLVDVVKGVEDPEYVDARPGGLLDEGHGHLVGVGGVTDGIPPPYQHLQADVRDRLARGRRGAPTGPLSKSAGRHRRLPHPRLPERAARGSMREKYGAAVQHVRGAQPGGQQRLVGVAQRRVRYRDGDLLAQPPGEPVGTELLEELAAARGTAPAPRLASALASPSARRRGAFLSGPGPTGAGAVGPVHGDIG